MGKLNILVMSLVSVFCLSSHALIGTIKLKAQVKSFTQEKVVLLTEDGRTFSVPRNIAPENLSPKQNITLELYAAEYLAVKRQLALAAEAKRK